MANAKYKSELFREIAEKTREATAIDELKSITRTEYSPWADENLPHVNEARIRLKAEEVRIIQRRGEQLRLADETRRALKIGGSGAILPEEQTETEPLTGAERQQHYEARKLAEYPDEVDKHILESSTLGKAPSTRAVLRAIAARERRGGNHTPTEDHTSTRGTLQLRSNPDTQARQPPKFREGQTIYRIAYSLDAFEQLTVASVSECFYVFGDRRRNRAEIEHDYFPGKREAVQAGKDRIQYQQRDLERQMTKLCALEASLDPDV
jgi:hypothetical protein